MVRLGTLDFQVCGVAHVSRFVPEMNTLILPYLWKDTNTMFAALDGRMGQSLEPLLLDKGFKVAGWWDNGFRHISNSKRPVRTAEDLRGLKLRTLPTKVHVAFFRALGVAPTPMDWAEVYPALQQGVVDGQENPPGVVYFEKLAEVQKYYSLTGHVNEPVTLLNEPHRLHQASGRPAGHHHERGQAGRGVAAGGESEGKGRAPGKLVRRGHAGEPGAGGHAGPAGQGRAEDLRRGCSPTSGPRARSSSSSAWRSTSKPALEQLIRLVEGLVLLGMAVVAAVVVTEVILRYAAGRSLIITERLVALRDDLGGPARLRARASRGRAHRLRGHRVAGASRAAHRARGDPAALAALPARRRGGRPAGAPRPA